MDVLQLLGTCVLGRRDLFGGDGFPGVGADGTITLFDNEADPKIGDQTRLLTLKVEDQCEAALAFLL